MSEYSGFHHLLPALTAVLLMLGGCAAPATVTDGSSPIQQDKSSEPATAPDSGDTQAGNDTGSSAATSPDMQGLETEGASVSLADLKEKAVKAWEAQGFVLTDTTGDPQDQVTGLQFESQDQPVLVHALQNLRVRPSEPELHRDTGYGPACDDAHCQYPAGTAGFVPAGPGHSGLAGGSQSVKP